MLKARFSHMLRSTEFKLTLLFLVLLICFVTVDECRAVYGEYRQFVPPANQQYIGFTDFPAFYEQLLSFLMLPLLAAFAYAHNYYTDRRSGMLLFF